MCGIFGIISHSCTKSDAKKYNKIFNRFSILSETRGKESSGTVLFSPADKNFFIIKSILRYSKLVNKKSYRIAQDSVAEKYNGVQFPYIAIGHSRLVTHGSRIDNKNNQPVVRENSITIHNGIIVNYKDIYNDINYKRPKTQLDTEVIPAYLEDCAMKNYSITQSLDCLFKRIKGTLSACTILPEQNKIILMSNNGSLYYTFINNDTLFFASEKFIVEKVLKSINREDKFDDIKQIITGYKIIDIKLPEHAPDSKFKITNIEDEDEIIKNADLLETFIDINMIKHFDSKEEKMLENNWDRISLLKRCSKCLLPETFPFIHFDNAGVCNYCLNHVPGIKEDKPELLQKIVSKYKRKKGEPDCIIPFSGGRDSSYVLHIAKTKLGLNPITLTYDWGMVTDLARRNIARICGKLGVENIIVSADIMKKRRYIRKNILAWLRNPQLGMIPLFMAGDKYFFYHTNLLKRDTGAKLNIWGINPLENTKFKVGFAGVPPSFMKDKIYSMKVINHFKLYSYFMKNYFKNHKYLNESFFDTIGSYMVRYFYPQKHYYVLFDYLKWDENKIVDTLISEYEWEKAIDTDSTWRIGDGTAPFYNYIYYTVAGFNEFDTFRSNQIREGLITREQGLEMIKNDNMPRYKSIKWYLDILSLDFREVVSQINKIPKLY